MKNYYGFILSLILLLWPLPLEASGQETLTHALITACQSNPSLEAERAKLRSTDEEVAEALSHWRPTVEASGNIGKTYQFVPAESQFGTAHFSDTTRGYGVQVTQPIFRGFKTLAETEAAEKDVDAGRARLNQAEQNLLLQTATAFLDTVRDETLLANDKENEEVLQKKLEETSARSKAGDLTETDVRQAESRLARARSSRYQVESTLSDDQSVYQRLVGYEPGPLETPNLNLTEPKDLEEVIHLSETRNPDVLTSQFEMESAKAQIHLNEGSLLPELDIVGNTGQNWGQNTTLPGRIDSSQILAQLKFPLYNGGSDYAKIRAIRETATQHRMELEDARHHARELANKAWKTLLSAEEQIKADKIEIESSGRALEGVRVESKAGTRTTLDVLNAEQELLDAKTDLARSEHDKNLAVLQIKFAMGDLTVEGLKLPIDAKYDPEKHYKHDSGALIGVGTEEDSYSDAYSSKDGSP